MKKATSVIVIFLVFGLLALWSPWMNWNVNIFKLLGVNKAETISGLQVYSLSGELFIYIDGEKVGDTTLERSPFVYDSITPGQHLVRIDRNSSTQNAYASFSKLINFEQNVDTVISINLGPSEAFSEWHVISPIKNVLAKNNIDALNITSNIDDSSIWIDTSQLTVTDKKTNTTITLDKQYEIRVSKLGYEEQTFTILPSSQEERNKLNGFDIDIDVHLMTQPVNVE